MGPSFFETMNIPAVRGRTFTAADFERGRTLVIISESFANHSNRTVEILFCPEGQSCKWTATRSATKKD